MDGLFPQETVAELLGVDVRTLRQWRTTDFKESGNKLYFPAVRGKKTSKSYYHITEILAFLDRNPRYLDIVRGALLPEDDQISLLARARAAARSTALRGEVPPVITPIGLAACIPTL